MLVPKAPLPGTDALLAHLRPFVCPWRSLTIAVDGRNGAGKSSLARHLGWQLGIPVVETDFWLLDDVPIKHNVSALMKLIRWRHKSNRPVIVEGIAMLQTLKIAGLQPDYLVMVTNTSLEVAETEICTTDHADADTNITKCLSTEVEEYLNKYRPQDRADWHVVWTEPR